MKLYAALAAALFLPMLANTAAADHSTFLVGWDATTAYGDSVTLKAQLWEASNECGFSGGPCVQPGRAVDFYVDGAYVGTDVTDSGGYAYLLITAAQAWHVGDHAIRAQYDRFSSPSTPATVTKTLSITQETTGVAAHKGYFEAQLTTDDNEALSGFAVRFYVNTPAGPHDVCTAFTDATGTARCVGVTGAGLSALNDPHTEYHAAFDGTGDYAASDGAANLV